MMEKKINSNKKGTRTMMGRTDMKLHENTISVLTIHDLDIHI